MNLEPRRNVYVGHRYVPKIMGEWSKENTYEGLSIVTFEGASYTSKKHVPAGIDIKNEEYWVLTGNYNAQIEYYRKETEGVKKENELQDIQLKEINDTNDLQEKALGVVKKDLSTTKSKLDNTDDILLNGKNFGIKMDGTDETQKIQEFIDYCFENKMTAFLKGETLITKQLNIQCNFDFSQAIFNVSHEGTALFIGRYEGNAVEGGFAYLPKMTKTGTLRGNSKAIVLHNLNRWTVTIMNAVKNFGVGLHLTANNYGTAYNNITWNAIINNKINIEIYATRTGWVNENKFFGGSATHTTDLGYGLTDHHNLKIHLSDDSPYLPDNNVFFAPSFEGSVPYHAIYIHGQQNFFYSGRFEAHEGYKYRILFKGRSNAPSVSNTFLYGYGLGSVEFIESDNAMSNTRLTPNLLQAISRGNDSALKIRNIYADYSPAIEIGDMSVKDRIMIAPDRIDLKNNGDTQPRIRIRSNGNISMGDGQDILRQMISYHGDGVKFDDGIVSANSSYDKNVLRLGEYYLWFDNDGKLRSKKGKPNTAIDGNIVGQ